MAKSLVQYSVVDAFTDLPFKGNPAVVCLLEEEKSDEWLQAVAREFNIPVTCYLTQVPDSEFTGTSNPRFTLRWFSPVTEVALCGHATLAASHALFTSVVTNSDVIEYTTLSGILTAKKLPATKITPSSEIPNGKGPLPAGFLIELDFPAVPIKDCNSQQMPSIARAMNGASIVDMKLTANNDLLFILPSAEAVESFQPQFNEIVKCPGKGVIITADAPSDTGFDFYSRFFFPKLGVNEDQICGSAHCSLALYWNEKLKKDDFVANAASPRGGIVKIHLDKKKQRVMLRGKAATVMKGSLLV